MVKQKKKDGSPIDNQFTVLSNFLLILNIIMTAIKLIPLKKTKFSEKERLLSTLAKNQFRRIAVHKERKQIRATFNENENQWNFYSREDQINADPYQANTILIEQTMIPRIQSTTYTLQTICCEASNIKIIEKFKKTFIRLTNEQPMGYPGFLIFLLG